jgi:pyrimidine-nucleoside phosphorylase
MSKKLAEGIDALVLDLKVGSGAFLPELDRGLELARTMIRIGEAYGCEVIALVTAMDRPLGHAIGNALEMEEAILTLQGEGPGDLREVTVALAAEMLVLGGITPTLGEGRAAARAALGDGRALDRMRVIVEAQGGNPMVLDDPALLPQAPVRRVVEAKVAGIVMEVDAFKIGQAAVVLGAGRGELGAKIDPAVGFHLTAKPGDEVEAGTALGTIHARTAADAERARKALAAAITIGSGPARPLPLISHRVTAAGTEVLETGAFQ